MEWNYPELIFDKNFLKLMKSPYCICCLAKNVQFVYLYNCVHSNLLRILFGNMLIKEDDLVCLGCHKVLQNFYKFKLQVEESVRLINQQISLPNIKKLHTLQTTNVDIYNTPTKVKLESEENSYDNTIFTIDIFQDENTDIKQETSELNLDTENIIPIPIQTDQQSRKSIHKKEIEENLIEDDKNVLSPLTNEDGEPTTSVPTKKLRYSCEECGRRYRWRCHLERHVAAAHVTSYMHCKHCSKAFKNQLALRRHTQSIHEKKYVTNSAPAQCPICQKMFKWTKTLRVHLKKIHRPDASKEEERYCVECNKLFISKQNYDLHLKNNLKHAVKKYECHDCGKRFASKGNLVPHIQLRHLKSKQYACGVCGKQFYKPYLRRLHERHNHMGVPRERNHVCAQCGKAFTCSTVLKRHMVIHSGAKPYQCRLCPSSFTQKSTLTTHHKFKHKDAPT